MRRQWKLLIALFGVCLCLGSYNTVRAEAENKATEIIILLDSTKSIEKESFRIAQDWIEDMLMLCRDSDMRLRVYTFASDSKGDKLTNEFVELVNGKVTADTSKEQIQKIEAAQIGGNYTNQAAAIESVKGIIDETSVSKRIVIMLSDGDLDFDDEKDILTIEEDKAKEQFSSVCKDIAGVNDKGEENFIYLIGFKNDISLFRNIEDGKHIFYKNVEEVTVDDILSELDVLEKMGFVYIQEKQEEVQNSEITFDLNEDYAISILRVKKSLGGSKLADQKENDIIFTQTSKGENVAEKVNYIAEETYQFCYFYLYNPEKGSYRLKMPNGFVEKYKVRNKVKENVDFNFKFELYDAKTKEPLEVEQNENGTYYYKYEIEPGKTGEVELKACVEGISRNSVICCYFVTEGEVIDGIQDTAWKEMTSALNAYKSSITVECKEDEEKIYTSAVKVVCDNEVVQEQRACIKVFSGSEGSTNYDKNILLYIIIGGVLAGVLLIGGYVFSRRK